jgi:predicted DNA-binding transcriptional regulator AlpA
MADSDLITIDEAAGLLRTPVGTLRYWRYLNTGPRSFKIGRRVVYRRSDVDMWIEAQQNAVA